MLPAKFLWGSVLLRGELQKYAKNSNFENFQSALYSTSVSMPLTCVQEEVNVCLCEAVDYTDSLLGVGELPSCLAWNNPSQPRLKTSQKKKKKKFKVHVHVVTIHA